MLEIFLPFLGVLAPYKISVVPITAIALFFIFLSKVIGGKITVSKKSKTFFMLFIYMVFRDILHMLFSEGGAISTQLNRLIEYAVLYILVFLVVGKFDENILYKWWKIAGVIFGAGMIYHVFQILVLNQPAVPITIIPGYVLRSDSLEGSFRPTSFFAEPAAYTTSMMPLLFLALKRNDLKWAFLSTFLIVVSTSTVGVILSATMWILFILFQKKPVRKTITAIFFICAFVAIFLNSELFSDTLSKLESVAAGESTFGSRVQVPFEVISLMDLIHLPFGSDVLEVKAFVLANRECLQPGSATLYYAQTKDSVFLNTFASLIFRYGIVGLCLFLLCFKNKLLNSGYEARMYAIMLLIASFGQGNIVEPGIPMMLLLLYACNDNCNKDDSKREVFKLCQF